MNYFSVKFTTGFFDICIRLTGRVLNSKKNLFVDTHREPNRLINELFKFKNLCMLQKKKQ